MIAIEWINQLYGTWKYSAERNTPFTLRLGVQTVMLLTKEQILQARSQRKTEIVDAPAWGGQVIIIGLSGKERDAFESDMVSMGGNGKQQMNLRNVRAKLVGRSIVDPADFDMILDNDGSGRIVEAKLKPDHMPRRMFTDIEVNDLGDVDAFTLQQIFERAQKLSGITKDDVSELVGDLKNDQSGASGLN